MKCADRYLRKLRLGILAIASIAFPALAVEQLTEADVLKVITQGVSYAKRLNPDSKAVIAVLDREGFVLGVWDVSGGAAPSSEVIAGAVSRGGTAAFLSSNQNAFTSRTAGFIIQQHFPPGVRNTSPGPLVGVGFSNLFYSDVNRFKKIPDPFDPQALTDPFQSPGTRGEQVPFTSLADSPGGVPLYKNGELVGGVGVTGDGSPSDLSPAAAILAGVTQVNSTVGYKVKRDVDEEVALAAQSGFRPAKGILATNVLLGGIRIPYAASTLSKFPEPGVALDPLPGSVVAEYPIQAAPALFDYEHPPFGPIPDVVGEIRQKIRADPDAGLIGGTTSRLTENEVREILTLAAKGCSKIRAGIRMPNGTRAQTFITVVNNPDSQGSAPKVLGTFRAGTDTTMFSWDVSAQKARTALFFSSNTRAMSCRAVGFLAQQNYPPGLNGRKSGPLFGFQDTVSLSDGVTFPGNPNLPNGVTIFPGGLPLYRNGVLVGAIGVSGDGVDQDDMVAAFGCGDFAAPDTIRSDNFSYLGARLPYVKFPRNPTK